MRVIVDFQTAEGDAIWALTSHVRDNSPFGDASEGSVVLLDDTEGRTVTGVIESIDSTSEIMQIQVLWETWQDVSVFGLEERDFPVDTTLVRDPRSLSGVFAAA